MRHFAIISSQIPAFSPWIALPFCAWTFSGYTISLLALGESPR
jgi:hypothetical protein